MNDELGRFRVILCQACNNNLIRNCTTSVNYFSAIHSNIGSLTANIDNFKEMFCELNHILSVIASTETKIKVNKIISVILAYQATLSYHNPAYRMLVVLLFMLIKICNITKDLIFLNPISISNSKY